MLGSRPLSNFRISSVCLFLALFRPKCLALFYDTNSFRHCVTNKTWCIYGDSTIEETIHDMSALLAGLNTQERLNFYRLLNTEHTKRNISLGLGVLVLIENEGHERSHRLMKVYCQQIGFELKHRFTGHRILNENSEGITALILHLMENWKYLAETCDEILINSAAHDWSRGAEWMHEEYIDNLESLLRFLRIVHSNNTKPHMFWKGNAWYAYKSFDGYGRYAFEEQLRSEYRVYEALKDSSVKFINVSDALTALPEMPQTAKIDRPGPHIGQAGARLEQEGSLMWTTASTQRVIEEMCEWSPRV